MVRSQRPNTAKHSSGCCTTARTWHFTPPSVAHTTATSASLSALWKISCLLLGETCSALSMPPPTRRPATGALVDRLRGGRLSKAWWQMVVLSFRMFLKTVYSYSARSVSTFYNIVLLHFWAWSVTQSHTTWPSLYNLSTSVRSFYKDLFSTLSVQHKQFKGSWTALSHFIPTFHDNLKLQHFIISKCL